MRDVAATWGVEDVSVAVEPLASMLGADGYELVTAVADGLLRVAVVAGPDACPTCLVPIDLFESMVRERLRSAGLDPALGSLTIEYPGA